MNVIGFALFDVELEAASAALLDKDTLGGYIVAADGLDAAPVFLANVGRRLADARQVINFQSA